MAPRAARAAPHDRELQALIDLFVKQYNRHRPHRSLPHRATPATAYQARPKATPTAAGRSDNHHRVRHDKIDTDGKLTLRVNGRLHHIGMGRTLTRTPVIMLILKRPRFDAVSF